MAYFDESGKWRQQDFICLAGFIGDESHLESLCKTWGLLLNKHQIPLVHTTDLMSDQPPYHLRKWENGEKRQVVTDFAAAIGKNIIRGVTVGLDAKAYRDLPKDTRNAIGDPFTFCFSRVMRLVIETLVEWEWKEPIGLIFDDDQHTAMKCYSLFCKIKQYDPRSVPLFCSITFADDRVFYPLQAADMIAYATARERRRGAAAWDESGWFRKILIASDDPFYGRQYVSEYWDAEGLKRADRSSIPAIIESPSPREEGDSHS
ncbi:MAG: DUF3800 domain-containing protein [Thermoanaerobaculia bacterium]